VEAPDEAERNTRTTLPTWMRSAQRDRRRDHVAPPHRAVLAPEILERRGAALNGHAGVATRDARNIDPDRRRGVAADDVGSLAKLNSVRPLHDPVSDPWCRQRSFRFDPS